MADESDRNFNRDEGERGPRIRVLRRHRREERYSPRPADQPVSSLSVFSLVIAIFALVGSLIPCVGMFAIPVAVIAIMLSGASLLIARQQQQATGVPITATAVSGAAVLFSLLWIALFSSVFHSKETRTAHRPPPPPVEVRGAPAPMPPRANVPPKKPVEPPLSDEQFEKKLLDDLAKDRIKEAIRNGPGIAVTAATLETAFTTNIVSAEQKYKDKVLEVTGKVVRVVQNPTKTVYALEIATDDPTKTVSCDFTEKTKYLLAPVERGQSVTVRGLCTGRDNEFVKLRDCVVAK